MSREVGRILFLVSAHNGLSQRAWVALTELGHDVAVAVVDSDAEMEAAVAEHQPGLIVCPFLKRMIPESIWSRHRCLIVHPGPIGDRGPSSLDWAIELGARAWGVTVLEANGEFDAGRVWATREFPMREVGKSSIYRHEVRHAAIEALLEAIRRIAEARWPPNELGRRGRGRRRGAPVDDPGRPRDRVAVGQHRGGASQDSCGGGTSRSARRHPGRRVSSLRRASRAGVARPAGEIIATRAGAICRATLDGAVWITHLKRTGHADAGALQTARHARARARRNRARRS